MKLQSKRLFSLFMSFVLVCGSFCFSPALFAYGGTASSPYQTKVNNFVASWCGENITANMTDFQKVKSVYDFVVKNTDYDVPASKTINDVDLGERSAHSVYAAIYGQVGVVAVDSAKIYDSYLDTKVSLCSVAKDSTVTVNSYVKTVDGKEYYKISLKSNSTIISGYTLMSNITIDNTLSYDPDVTFDKSSEISQGFAVCEGYSELVKELLDYIGISSEIVTTVYTADNIEKGHAWNIVNLDGKYYNFDTTYGASTSVKIMNDFSYSYFLRGYNADVMSDDAHNYETVKSSCASDEKRKIIDLISPTDYSSSFDGNTAGYFVYYCQRISADVVKATDKLVYNGSDYKSHLKLVIPSYVCGKDYMAYFNDDYTGAGTKSVTIEYIDLDGVTQTKTLYFSIAPHDLSTTDIDKESTTRYVYFSGQNVNPTVSFVSTLKLDENVDYTVSFYRDSSCAVPTTDLMNPGTVYVCVDGINNCRGEIKLSFEIKKADLSVASMKPINSVRLPSYTLDSFTMGGVTLVKGTDYSLGATTYSNGNNVGSVANIAITALPSSRYLVGTGNIAINITGGLDLSSLNGKAFTSSTYTYSGSAITPKPDLSISIGTQKITLKYGTDYVVDKYNNNASAGTASAEVSFVGNYTGKATMYFSIDKMDITKLSATVGNCYYTGKSHYPSVTIKQGSKTLKYGADYSLSGAATKCGAYKLTVKGINNYSGSFQKVYVVRPKKVSGLKKASNTTSKITLSWYSQSSITSSSYPIYYSVYAYDYSKKSWRVIVSNTRSTSYTVSALYSNGKKVNLSAGRVYKFKVIAYIYYGKSKYYGTYSDIINAETRPSVSRVTIYTPSTSSSSITAKWKRASASGYLVYASPYSNFSKSVSSKLITSYKTTSYRFTKLKRGKYYYVKVKAFKTVNGVRYYGSWSYTKKIKCK